MLNEKAIYKIQEMVIEEIEKLYPEYKEKFYVSPMSLPWLIQTVIEKYYGFRYGTKDSKILP